MHLFVILSCMATAYAANLGYDYGRRSGGNSGIDYIPPSSGFIPEQTFQTSPASGAAEFEKEFFTFSAFEGEFGDEDANQQFDNDMKRGLRVIFIKGPENTNLENAAQQLIKSAIDQHTAIYVLNKQSDIGELNNKLNALNTNNANKPEVHFVRYRTPADAEYAQRAIQNQYDGLGGKTSSHDGGTAPVLNFASKIPLRRNNESAPVVPGNAYLPANEVI